MYKVSFGFSIKVAAIQDSFEYRFGLRRNARLNPGKYRLSVKIDSNNNNNNNVCEMQETRRAGRLGGTSSQLYAHRVSTKK